MNKTGVIYGINGPVVYLKGNTGFKMSEMVYVGKERLVGEVIALTKDTTTVQVFEETTGLKPGETVTASGDALSVTLGPGILNNIFDGIERPLSEIAKQSGKYISRGLTVDSLDTEKKWDVHVTVSEGEELMGGAIIAETQETRSIVHKSMVPPDVNGTVIWAAKDGKYTILDPIVKLKLEDGTEKEITLAQKWPIRVPRPTLKRYPASVPLITGQRILDTMFPIAKGGTAAIPGGFGTGKTMTQHQIAKWSDADIIIYIGCGERGNEMTQVLEEFQELIDPKSGNPLMDRTTLIANTSNMPVAAREASIYTGVTLAEYYRDMGYDVARQNDAHEVAGVGDGLVACAEEVENVVEEDEPQRGEGESYHHVQHDGVAEYQECPLFVALSQTYGDERGGSDAYQRPEGRHEVHQRHGDGQPADGHRSDAVAYEDAVDDVVER